MAKGSKKYAGHEYSFASPAKSGLGSELGKHKSEASSSRQGSRTYPRKMNDGGTVTPAPASGSNTNAALAAMGQAVSKPQAAVGGSLLSKILGRAKGGEIKAQNKEQKATHKGNNPKDDKVLVAATEGEIMLPKSVTKSKNAPEKAKKFVEKEKKKD